VKEGDLAECSVGFIMNKLNIKQTDSEYSQVKSIVDRVLLERIAENEDAKLAQALHEQENGPSHRRQHILRTRERKKRSAPSSIHANGSSKKMERATIQKGGLNRPMSLSPALRELLDGANMVRFLYALTRWHRYPGLK